MTIAELTTYLRFMLDHADDMNLATLETLVKQAMGNWGEHIEVCGEFLQLAKEWRNEQGSNQEVSQ